MTKWGVKQILLEFWLKEKIQDCELIEPVDVDASPLERSANALDMSKLVVLPL